MSRSVFGLFGVVLGFSAFGADHTSREQVRLRAHFDSVLVELRAGDVAALTLPQRVSRGQLIGWLADYRDAGRFPLNDRFGDEPTPIFRDARGVTCAMAYLIERSGRRDIVDRISSTRNLGYIRDLAGDTDLVGWLESSGLSVAEAARIQPQYPGDHERRSRELTRTTIAFSGTSLLAAGWIIARPSTGRGVVGLLVGGLTALVGNGLATGQERYRIYSRINIAAGGIAILSGIYAIGKEPVPIEQSALVRRGMDWIPLLDVVPESRTARLGIAARF